MNPLKSWLTSIVSFVLTLVLFAVIVKVLFNWSLSDLFHTTITFKQALGALLISRLFGR